MPRKAIVQTLPEERVRGGLESRTTPSASHTTTASPMLSMTALQLRGPRLLGDGEAVQALVVARDGRSRRQARWPRPAGS